MKFKKFIIIALIAAISAISVCLCREMVKNKLPVSLGMSRTEVEVILRHELTMNATSIDYLGGKPTSQEIKRDVVFYAEESLPGAVTIFLGFNAQDRLIELRRLEVWRLTE